MVPAPVSGILTVRDPYPGTERRMPIETRLRSIESALGVAALGNGIAVEIDGIVQVRRGEEG